MSLEARKRISGEIAKEYRRWRQKKGEPSMAQRKQIVAIGMSKARRNPDRLVARWEVQGGKDWIELLKGAGGRYFYRGVGMGGALPNMMGDGPAIAYMEKGPVSVLRIDRPSVKRVPLIKNNPIDIGTALVGGMAAGATGALVRHAMQNPSHRPGHDPWFVGVTEAGQVELKATTAPLHEKWVQAYGPFWSKSAAQKQAASARDWFKKGGPVMRNPLNTRERAQIRESQAEDLRNARESRSKSLFYGAAHFQGRADRAGEIADRYRANPLLQTIMGANPVSGPMDEDAARELELFITSDADLYRQQYTPIIQNLMRKRAKGVFDPAKAVTLFMYLVESGAKKYIKQFGTPGSRIDTVFNRNTRLDVAKTLTESFITEADLGNYDRMMLKKNPLVHSLAPRSQRDYSSAYIYPTPPASKLRVSYTRPGHPSNKQYTVPLADSVAVKDVLENPRKFKPNGFVYIDSSDDAILGFWKGSMTDKKAFVTAESLAKKLGRNVHIVASPGFPSWMKQKGAKVSKIFYHMGPFQTITPSGEYISGGRNNPLTGAEKKEIMGRAKSATRFGKRHRRPETFGEYWVQIGGKYLGRGEAFREVASQFNPGLPCPPFCPNPEHKHQGGSYEVYVGNIGRVYSGPQAGAEKAYAIYVSQSESRWGRASGEDVTLTMNGEPIKEHFGKRSTDFPESNGHPLTGRSAGENPGQYDENPPAKCVCGHHALAHRVAYREEFGGRAGRYGFRGACGDCGCRRYRSAAQETAGENPEPRRAPGYRVPPRSRDCFVCGAYARTICYGGCHSLCWGCKEGREDQGPCSLARQNGHRLIGRSARENPQSKESIFEEILACITEAEKELKRSEPNRKKINEYYYRAMGLYSGALTREDRVEFTELHGSFLARMAYIVPTFEKNPLTRAESAELLHTSRNGGKCPASSPYGPHCACHAFFCCRCGAKKSQAKNPLTRTETAHVLQSARYIIAKAERAKSPEQQIYYAGVGSGRAGVARDYGPVWEARYAERIGDRAIRASTRAQALTNPGKRKVTMSIQKFAAMLQKKGDPKMIAAFKQKINGYKKWTHGTMPKTVTLERKDVPGVNGLWITYGAGKEPESTYVMPGNSKRKGAWKHEWDTMPDIRHDPEAGIILKQLHGSSKISDFYHK